MTKHIKNFIVYALTVWAAELMVTYVKHFIHIKTGTKNPYLNTVIGMLVIVAIFIPIIKIADYVFEHLTEKVVKGSEKATGNSLLGILFAFLIGFGILFLFYLKEWYGKSLF